MFCEYSPAGNVVGEFGGNVGKAGQGADGEPGVGDSSGDEEKNDESGSDQRSVGAQLLVALVAMSTLAGLFL